MLPEAVIITIDEEAKDDSEPTHTLKFCNKSAGNLARERLEEMTSDQLSQSNLLELKIF